MFTVVSVGGIPVGAFTTDKGKTRCINAIAPGCRPVVKKGYQPKPVTQMHSKVQQQSKRPQRGSYEIVRYLKPGEFTL